METVITFGACAALLKKSVENGHFWPHEIFKCLTRVPKNSIQEQEEVLKKNTEQCRGTTEYTAILLTTNPLVLDQ